VDDDGFTGTRHTASLRQGAVDYWETGTGRPVVFVHGLFVNSALWRHVAPVVAAAGFRCIVPDWPFGGHRRPMPAGAVLDPPAVAALILDFLAQLDLRDTILVTNDTGGAFTQVAITGTAERTGGTAERLGGTAERIGALVITPGDSFEYFFPPQFKFLGAFGSLPGSGYLLAQTLRVRPLHRLPQVFGLLSKRPIPAAAMSGYLTPMRENPGTRRDLQKILRGVDKRHTLAAAERFAQFDRPVLLAWATEDKVFPLALAERMRGLFPHADLAPIDDSYTFVPEDQPQRLAELIIGFGRRAALPRLRPPAAPRSPGLFSGCRARPPVP
jgi:pimeloyl-ACP methyl ester carboxylesterase